MSNLEINPIRKQTASAMKMVGSIVECSQSDTSNIGEVWHTFGPKIDSVPDKIGDLAFGVIWDTQNSDGRFKYMAAVDQDITADTPSGMDFLDVPETTYAVFEHIGSLNNLKDTIQAIFASWLPQSGEALGSFPSMLEVYGDEFDPQTSSGRIELWVTLA